MTGKALETVTIKNELGLHARAAAAFVKLAMEFPCAVTVTKDGCSVNGKSITSLIMLSAVRGSVLEIEASGSKAEECVGRLKEVVENNFGEDK